jgi:hypothetical protein
LLICDDIRQEVGGKQSLMGLYNDAIIFGPAPEGIPVWPKLMRLGFFIRLSFNEDDKIQEGTTFSFSFRRGDESVEIAKGPLAVQGSAHPRFASLSIMTNPFVINGPGEMTFTLLLLDSQGKAFKTFAGAGSIKSEQR